MGTGSFADAALELIIKIMLAIVIIWVLMRWSFFLWWYVQPFVAGFLAGMLVTLLFFVRWRR